MGSTVFSPIFVQPFQRRGSCACRRSRAKCATSLPREIRRLNKLKAQLPRRAHHNCSIHLSEVTSLKKQGVFWVFWVFWPLVHMTATCLCIMFNMHAEVRKSSVLSALQAHKCLPSYAATAITASMILSKSSPPVQSSMTRYK